MISTAVHIDCVVFKLPLEGSDDSSTAGVTEGRVGQLHGTDRTAERFALSEAHLASYQTLATDPALETLRSSVPVLITQRHALVLNNNVLRCKISSKTPSKPL